MKKFIYTLVTILVSSLSFAQTQTENYIKNTSYSKAFTDLSIATDNDKIETITYYDGLGRPKQVVNLRAGGDKQDIITHIEYDAFGRQAKDYLPYATATNSGQIAPNPIQELESFYFTAKYENTLNPFSEKEFEASPLNRVLKQAAPGEDWKLGSGHEIQFDYQTNNLNPENPLMHYDSHGNYFDNVILFDVAHPGGDTEKTELVFQGHYDANELYKTITKDENWTPSANKNHTTEEYKNKQGQVILKRTYNNNKQHDTYYVYDDYGNLTYVIPPTASDEILHCPTCRISQSSQDSFSWINMVEVDKNFAEEYNKKLEEYKDFNILTLDLDNEYGAQGGFTINTDAQGGLNFTLTLTSTQAALSLKNGELLSLKPYGDFNDAELGLIKGAEYEYIFYIKNNSIYIEGSGKLSNATVNFSNDSKLAYQKDILWTDLLKIDERAAIELKSSILEIAKIQGASPLTIYKENEYGAQGGMSLNIDETDNITLIVNLSQTQELPFKEEVLIPLETKRRFQDRELGIIQTNNYTYHVSIIENSLSIRGEGNFTGLTWSNFTPPPTPPPTYTINTATVEGLCYIYHYDHRNRLVEKKIPGKGCEHIVYDKQDRPVAIQDAKQRLNNQWLFTKYDILRRVVITGKFSSSQTRVQMQNTLNIFPNQSNNTSRHNVGFNHGGINIRYSTGNAGGYPLLSASDFEILTVAYYDDYNFNLNGLTIPATSFGKPIINYSNSEPLKTKGLATGSIVRVLDNPNQWITSITGYDVKARPIYATSKNQYLNTTDVVKTNLDFIGKVLKTESTHTKDSNPTIVTLDTFTYDHANRLLTQSQTINGSDSELIVNNQYDELGQLISKNVGGHVAAIPENSQGLQTVDYKYNIRGWLKSINEGTTVNNDLFGFKLNYNTPELASTPLYNGNISETHWQTANDNKQRSYTYNYDALNRIKNANYHGNHGLVGAPTEIENYDLSNVNYDKNGNITALSRMGLQVANNQIDVIDNLTYSYEPLSNKLLDVNDTASEDGFKDNTSSSSTIDYTYDINGNMITDANKGIISIEYNHLNLPTKIEFSIGGPLGNNEINYTYDATGVKLEKQVINKEGFYASYKSTFYASDKIYERLDQYSNDCDFPPCEQEVETILKFINHPEGYKEPVIGESLPVSYLAWKYVYQFKDHLGNIRLSYSDADNSGDVDASEILEENNYYPFGLEHKGYNNVVASTNPAQNYKYNGKELNEELGLDWYDYGARNYDAAIGRFMTIDPKAETYNFQSTFAYAANNPIYYIDKNGEGPEAYPIVTITKQKTGKTAAQRVIGTSTSTQADLYKVTVTDTEDANFKMEFSVTRDAWVDTNGNGDALNVGFEPKDGKVNHFTGKVMNGGYPEGNGTEALKLTQRGSEVVHAEANQTAVDIGSRDKKDVAAGIMVHVAGNYENKGKSKVAASLGCFGVCNDNNSSSNPSNKQSNKIMNTIQNQANKSQTDPGKILVIIQKREGNEYPKEKKNY